MEKLNIILNGTIVEGTKGESILDLCSRNGIHIPTLCHDLRLEPFSSCYVCVVEVEGMRGLQPSCSTRIAEGMKINTENEKVKKSRKMALELLLSNHYADCTAPCKQTCPAGVDVQGYIALINKGLYQEAVGLIKKTNPLPAICGRVCVRPCEVACRRNLVEGTGVGIDYLKRFTSDIDLESEHPYLPEVKPASGKKVAIIGAGPGGLSAAFFLAQEGHHVEIFEASEHPGGMLRYGIPPYRLPNDIIDKEVQGITALGVKIHYKQKLGENLSYSSLKENFNSVILAIGSQNGTSIGCENDDAGNIFAGIDFLRNMEATGLRYDFKGKKVAVIGGGNTAMDCCRTAKRCGAEEVTVIYRRTEKEMPANPIEIHESKLEGINYMFLTAPAKVNPDENGNLKSLTCYKMELGEPDASGRRRPVKVEGSEFDVELDIILAAIGQKTNVNFIDDINKSAPAPLVINKWGDIQADPGTLQTSIENVFACGDGVTGPATLIEAIAQGRKAANSCHQYLTGSKIEAFPYEFISKKENFEKQKPEDYKLFFVNRHREEMPTLEPEKRSNFDEVELGYTALQAQQETERCLECGCVEYYSCDLKRLATEYHAEQKHYEGSYQKRQVDFRHPFIEIDNNKCILCSRCIRICTEVVGANALGLVKRGFETFVAPSLNSSLTHTLCESCGMCISTCPTAAISENFNFKPGPIETDTFETICNFCSVGCNVEMHHKKDFFTSAKGAKGLINDDANICRYPKFGYRLLNNGKRISKPMLRKADQWLEVSFEEAYELMAEKIKTAAPAQNAFFAGARLTNEELYLIQKLARTAGRTPLVGNFHYLASGTAHMGNSENSVSFDEFRNASAFFILGSEINLENAVAGFKMYNQAYLHHIPVELITTQPKSSMEHKADRVWRIKDYYAFVKAINFILLQNGLENALFIKDHCIGFDAYKSQLLGEDLNKLLQKAGLSAIQAEAFAQEYNRQPNAILIYSEKHISVATATELRNLNLITGKTGKTASGLLALKEKNNAQGLYDMGLFPQLSTGGISTEDETHIRKLRTIWGADVSVPDKTIDLMKELEQGSIKNAFIFGEDPMGCSIYPDTVSQWLKNIDFMVVQDYFLTPTAQMAHLVLPASMPFETGGSFTNTQKVIQAFAKSKQGPLSHNSLEQLNNIAQALGMSWNSKKAEEVFAEISASLSSPHSAKVLQFESTQADSLQRLFESGCDAWTKSFEDDFQKAFASHELVHV